MSYAENLFGKSYCYYLEESKADIVCAFTVSNASIFTKYLPNARKKKVGKHVPHIKQDLIYPAVLIGRLGISTKFQHLHIGTEVMDLNYNRKRDTVMEQQNKRKPLMRDASGAFFYSAASSFIASFNVLKRTLMFSSSFLHASLKRATGSSVLLLRGVSLSRMLTLFSNMP